VPKISEIPAAVAADVTVDALFPVMIEADAIDGTRALPRAELLALILGSIAWNETPGGTIDGSNTDFTLAAAPISGRLLLFRNGICLRPGVGHDYTLAGSAITLADAPASGSNLLAFYSH
jgi:hypothetical protein